MVDIWAFAGTGKRLKMKARNGKTFVGYVAAVWDVEEQCDAEEDCLDLDVDGGGIASFFVSDIEEIADVGKKQ